MKTKHFHTSIAAFAASACLFLASCSDSGGTWTYNPFNGTLAHSRSAWILTARQDGANLTVTDVHNAPKKPSALPLDAKIKDNYKITHIFGRFGYCDAIKSIKFPDSVTDIKLGGAFRDCPNLVSFSISKNNPNYKSINGVLFDEDAKTLVRYPPGKRGAYSIPHGVTHIGERVFQDCVGLTGISIPGSVTDIDSDAFSGCSALTRFSVSENNPDYKSIGGVLFDEDAETLVRYPPGKQGAYSIPDGVTHIGWDAFDGCTGLTNVTIPSSVTHIGERAFADCSGLTSVTIPSSVTHIGERAFAGCTALTSVTLSNKTRYMDGTFPGHVRVTGGAASESSSESSSSKDMLRRMGN